MTASRHLLQDCASDLRTTARALGEDDVVLAYAMAHPAAEARLQALLVEDLTEALAEFDEAAS